MQMWVIPTRTQTAIVRYALSTLIAEILNTLFISSQSVTPYLSMDVVILTERHLLLLFGSALFRIILAKAECVLAALPHAYSMWMLKFNLSSNHTPRYLRW